MTTPPPSLGGVWAFYADSDVGFQNVFRFGGPLQSDPSGNDDATVGISAKKCHTLDLKRRQFRTNSIF